MTIINMQTMRYINLLDKTSHVKTKKCFIYNNTIFFAVQKGLIYKAIGVNASNIRKVQEELGKRIKIIEESSGFQDIPRFIREIISPNKFKSIEIKIPNIIITAGSNQNKASLIGRNKRRFYELHKIVYDIFGLDLKIL